MKKFLSVVTVAAFMTACTSKQDDSAQKAAIIAAYQDSVRKAADTAGLAEFQNWKAENELAEVAQYNQAQYAAAAPVAQKARTYVPARKSSGTTARRRSSSSDNGGGSMNSTSENTASRKKGWSKAAKGAAIGTAGGAVVGAVVNKKNRVAGGVVGGVLGAGVGYGIGRGMDKKDGRY
jgi:hypothetical protein